MSKWLIKIQPDGTKKIEKIPPTQQEIEELNKRKLHHQTIKRLNTERRKEKEYQLDEFSELSEQQRAKKELFISLKNKICVRTSCWTWIGDDNSYKDILPKVFETFKEIKLNGDRILHKCDNSKCINPNHLYASKVEDKS